jgi:hypothetical protein
MCNVIIIQDNKQCLAFFFFFVAYIISNNHIFYSARLLFEAETCELQQHTKNNKKSDEARQTGAPLVLRLLFLLY